MSKLVMKNDQPIQWWVDMHEMFGWTIVIENGSITGIVFEEE